MRKEQLVRALLKVAKEKANGQSPKAKHSKQSTTKPKPSQSRIARKLRRERLQAESLKNLALVNERMQSNESPQSDRVIAVVRDPYWIQAYWEVTQATVERVKVAMSDVWFDTKPVLRLVEIKSNSSTSSLEKVVREIPIHGGVRNWYIDVPSPPKSYRIALGYSSPSHERFYLIAKSNLITTPTPDQESFDHNWTDISSDYKKFYALSGGYASPTEGQTEAELQAVFEEKLRRPMNAPAFVRLGNGIGGADSQFDFDVDAHMILQGNANPLASVTLSGEPVELRDDGSFTVKMELPDKRQVLPIVASSRDGTQQRTIVLAIERNTKVMEPVSKELEEV